MFSRVRDASKIALVDLVGRLRAGGFLLLDTQFLTEHLERFGAIEISRADYLRRLRRALARGELPGPSDYPLPGRSVLGDPGGGGGGGSGSGSSGSAQSITQTS